MKTFKNLMKGLWQDESAQGATEYILLLVAVVAVVILFKDKIRTILDDKLQSLGSDISGINSK